MGIFDNEACDLRVAGQKDEGRFTVPWLNAEDSLGQVGTKKAVALNGVRWVVFLRLAKQQAHGVIHFIHGGAKGRRGLFYVAAEKTNESQDHAGHE